MWKPTKPWLKYGVAIYNFEARSKWELRLEIGELVQISEEYRGEWYRGCSLRNRAVKGVFPASFIKIKKCKLEYAGPEEIVTPLEDSVVREVSYTLQEWNVIWKRLYKESDGENNQLLERLHSVMHEFLALRRQIISSCTTQDQLRDIKFRITSKIDWGNKQLGLDVVPRKDFQPVETDSISAIELYHLHQQSATNCLDNPISARRHSNSMKNYPHHLLLNVRGVSINAGEEFELFFSLYDVGTNKYFSEKFVTKQSKQDTAMNKKDMNTSCIFVNLGVSDLMRDAYLILHVYKLGGLKDGEIKKATGKLYRKPHGCAVYHIKEIFESSASQLDETSFAMKISVCSSECDFPLLHEAIIKRQGGRFSMLAGTNNLGVLVSLSMLCGDLNLLFKDNGTQLKGATVAQKLGFPDVIMPGVFRNDLYLILCRGEFEKGELHKKMGKNVEVRIVVIDTQGAAIPSCICGGAGEAMASEYFSVILYHNDKPRWNETIKLSIPIEKFRGSHIRLEFYHCSSRQEKQLFGFSFLNLVGESGTTISDGLHELYCFKSTQPLNRSFEYVKLAFSRSASPSSPSPAGTSSFIRSDKDFAFVETILCSTKLTQNANLLGLLNWRAQPDLLYHHLQNVPFVEGQEIVKYLHDILDALFNMFSMDKVTNPILHSNLVFQALIHIFHLLEERKFEYFLPVMDSYLKNNFSAPLVYRNLLISLKEKIDMGGTYQKQSSFIGCFQVIPYVFKFIVQSRLLFSRSTGGQEEEEFQKSLQQIFFSLCNLFESPHEGVSNTQMILFTKLPEVIDLLCQVCSLDVLAKQLCTLLKSLPLHHHGSSLLNARLRCLSSLTSSSVFVSAECRALLIPHIVDVLEWHLSHRMELSSAANTWGHVLNALYLLAKKKIDVQKNIHILCIGLVNVSIETLLSLDRSTAAARLLVSCVISIFRQMKEEHYQALLVNFSGRIALKDFLSRLITIYRELIGHHIFPNDWFLLKMVTNHAILISLQYVSQAMSQRFLHDSSFDSKLWAAYFRLVVAFLTQPTLQLHKHTRQKAEAVKNRYGDLRVQMGYEIVAMWQSLGPRKICFVPSLVEPFLQATLVPDEELRNATIPIFFDMMEVEYKTHRSFTQVESELIDKLDLLVGQNLGDERYKTLLHTILMEKVGCAGAWQSAATSLVQSISNLLERLLDYRSVLQGTDNDDLKMICTCNLLEFYLSEPKRQDTYIRYVHRLHDIHESCGNWTEAGMSLQLHANLLGWTNVTLEKKLTFPCQTEWQRKESLFRRSIRYFDRSKLWEYGIPLCKELANFYECRYDYAKLSKILKTQSEFFVKILTELRLEPEYFKVGFFGLGFLPFLRNKEFVYRGNDCERLGSLQSRLQIQFPLATFYNSTVEISETLKQSDCQCIQLCSVRPMPQLRDHLLDFSTSEKIVEFYRTNDVCCFQSDRPFHAGPKDTNNEFRTLHCHRTTVRTDGVLPGVIRWVEVTATTVQILSPIMTACDAMERKNQELRLLVTRFEDPSQQRVQLLSMRLQGVIDAAVNGGTARYQQAFFNQVYLSAHPNEIENISMLKSLFLEQMAILDSALLLHGRLVTADLQPLHKKLLEIFSKMKQNLKCLTVSSHKPHPAGQHHTPSPPASNRSSSMFVEGDGAPDASNETDGDSGIEVASAQQPVPTGMALTFASSMVGKRRFSSPLGGSVFLAGLTSSAPSPDSMSAHPASLPGGSVPASAAAKSNGIQHSDSFSYNGIHRNPSFSVRLGIPPLAISEDLTPPSTRQRPPPLPPKETHRQTSLSSSQADT